jgi:hypothetical protein
MPLGLHGSAGRRGAHDSLTPREVLVIGSLSPAQLLVALLRADAARPLLSPTALAARLLGSEPAREPS